MIVGGVNSIRPGRGGIALRRRVVDGLVWAVLALGVTGAVVALGPAGEGRPAPGHEAAGCRPCRSSTPYRGRALPFELDGRNVRADRDPGAGADRPGATEGPPADRPGDGPDGAGPGARPVADGDRG
jgi:hypothetical protein